MTLEGVEIQPKQLFFHFKRKPVLGEGGENDVKIQSFKKSIVD